MPGPELPRLPEPGAWIGGPAFTADQLQAYAREYGRMVVEVCIFRLAAVGCDHCAGNLRLLLEDKP